MSAASRPRRARYEVAIGKVAMLFTDLTEAGVNLRMMNLGGGFPIRYRDEVPEIDQLRRRDHGRDDRGISATRCRRC